MLQSGRIVDPRKNCFNMATSNEVERSNRSGPIISLKKKKRIKNMYLNVF